MHISSVLLWLELELVSFCIVARSVQMQIFAQKVIFVHCHENLHGNDAHDDKIPWINKKFNLQCYALLFAP